MICETTNVFYPLLADIYYPTVEQSAYGDVRKTWMLDATIACSFNAPSSKTKEELVPNKAIVFDTVLIGRTKRDIRFSTRDAANATTNVLVTDIRDSNGNLIYLETAGARAGKSTIFEIATNEPIVGPFGKVEYYKVILKRSENQGVEI